jgi:outer membrane protein OmpA-like peptidoglycan-associated protein
MAVRTVRNVWIAAALGAGAWTLVFSAGCATKGFVRNEMSTFREEMTQKTDQIAQDLDEVRNSADAARERADLAYGQVGEARDLALGKVGYREVGNHVVYFAFDSDEIDGTARGTLDLAGEQIRSRPDVLVDVLGFCDTRGSDRYNFDLGQRRANAVLRELTAQATPGQLGRYAGISYGRMSAAIGGEMPQEHAQQRRVVISLVERIPLEEVNPPQAESMVEPQAGETASSPYSTEASEQQRPVEP